MILPLTLTLLFSSCPSIPAVQRLRIASTTSTENSGLFEALNPPFEKRFNCRVDVIAVGTGKALKIASNGDVDLVFVHDREAEEKFLAGGYGVNRRDVMYNDFIIIGPEKDPAGIRGMKDAKEALRRVSETEALFISRGDDSGTHKRELKLWEKAGMMPEGSWYSEVGQGMGAVIQIANQKLAYTLTDRGTYLAYSEKIDLEVLSEGNGDLFNPYGIIAVNPARFPHINYVLAMAYIGWVTSAQGQSIIREFGKDRSGQPLFVPVAIP